MSVKQQIKFKDTIDFEQDQQDAMSKTENIQSLADQVERLEDFDFSISLFLLDNIFFLVCPI